MTERDEYTPSLDEVRADYVRDHTHGYDEFQGRYTLTAMQEFYGEQFDRMIEAVRQEERERIADAINAVRNHPTLIDLADKYGGWYQGQRTGLERAEGSAREQGKEQGR